MTWKNPAPVRGNILHPGDFWCRTPFSQIPDERTYGADETLDAKPDIPGEEKSRVPFSRTPAQGAVVLVVPAALALESVLVFLAVGHGGTFEGLGFLLQLLVGYAVSLCQIGISQVGVSQIGTVQVGTNQVGIPDVGSH